MKKKIWSFKQIYRDKDTKQLKEYCYSMIVVKDTECNKFRLLNLKDMSIWKNWKFDTREIAENFLNKHPHNINRDK